MRTIWAYMLVAVGLYLGWFFVGPWIAATLRSIF